MHLKKLNKKGKKLYLLSIILLCFILNFYLVSFYQNQEQHDNKANFNEQRFDNIAKSHGLTSENEYYGIGSPWNITHWANRTDNNLEVSFIEDSNDIIGIPLFSGWNGYELDININSLYDSRNWNNGTFNYGNDDNSYNTGEDDSNDIINRFQNWTFNENDPDNLNDMSGNYLNTSAPLSGGQDCLELRMDGEWHLGTGGDRYRYDEGDRCWWESNILIPRGRLIDGILKFQANPVHLISFNSWELTVSINNVQVYTIGILTLKQMGVDTWHNFSIPQGLWTNTSNVFTSTYLNDSITDIEISLRYSANSASYGFEDGENIDYQQILVDNIQLVTQAEVNPSDLSLKVNETLINDITWGKGQIALQGDWIGNDGDIETIFKCDDIGLLGKYTVYLKADLNLFAIKNTPESNYETKESSLGTQFSANNGTFVNWLCYGKIIVPTKYAESQMTIEFPTDISIIRVYEPQNPSLNILSQCDNSTPGILKLPVYSISATPDGFWKFEANSPNYFENLNFFNNATGNWIESNLFMSGDYINITAKVSNTPEVTGYLQNTYAELKIRFPGGNIWHSQNQLVSLNTNGFVYFEPIKIPSSSPNYEVGQYEAIITWNNSHSIFELNETGIIYKNFFVIHNSSLLPDQEFYEDILENSKINIKISFIDLVTSEPIENAEIYTYNFTNPTTKQFFSEISPGYYLLEFNVTGGILGNNSLIIYANSSYFINQVHTLKIEIIRETLLSVDKDFIDNVPFGQNFTIQFNYTEKGSSLGIDPDYYSTDWPGEHYFTRISQGVYNLTCNTTGYQAGQLYTLNLYVDAYMYQAKAISIKVYITELSTTLKVKMNNTLVSPNDIFTVQVWEQLNITAFYNDILGIHLSGATLNLSGENFIFGMIENPLSKQYTYIINAEDLGQGIENLNIYAHLINYQPQSIPFIIEIIERQTEFQIIFNGTDKTNDPTTEITVGNFLNVTVRYRDNESNHIENALVQFSGDYSGILIEYSALKQYTSIINTSELDIGIRLIALTAEKPNYQLQTANLRIVVNRIKVNITTLSGSPVFTAKTNEFPELKVVLIDETSGEYIFDANVSYRWQFGGGYLTDDDNDGIYETLLSKVSAGSYIITITAEKGDIYEFKRYEVILTIVAIGEDTSPYLWLLITAGIVAIGLISYLIAYVKVLKYPKQVRKIRKYRKTLKRTKDPTISIISREKAFDDSFHSEKKKVASFLKGKAAEEVLPGKLAKEKSLNLETKNIKTDGGE